jgi:hypothetical protein
MFLSVGIINNNFVYNYDYPTTGLQTQSMLYQLLLNLLKPVRASLAPPIFASKGSSGLYQ